MMETSYDKVMWKVVILFSVLSVCVIAQDCEGCGTQCCQSHQTCEMKVNGGTCYNTKDKFSCNSLVYCYRPMTCCGIMSCCPSGSRCDGGYRCVRDPSSSESSPTWYIVVGCIAGVLCIATMVTCIICCHRRAKAQEGKVINTPGQTAGPITGGQHRIMMAPARAAVMQLSPGVSVTNTAGNQTVAKRGTVIKAVNPLYTISHNRNNSTNISSDSLRKPPNTYGYSPSSNGVQNTTSVYPQVVYTHPSVQQSIKANHNTNILPRKTDSKPVMNTSHIGSL